MERGLLTTEAIAQYRSTLDTVSRKLRYLEQESQNLRDTVGTLLASATRTLAKERDASDAYGDDQKAGWTLQIATAQSRMMGELDSHIVTPWWRVHGRARYKRESYIDNNGWNLGFFKLIIDGPYPGWRVEIPAHPDKQGPGGDGAVDCRPWPCKWYSSGSLKYVTHCPDSSIISVASRNHHTRKNNIRAYWAKTAVKDCPDTWGIKTSQGSSSVNVPMPNPQSTDAFVLRLRLTGDRAINWYVPAIMIRGEAPDA